MKVKKKTCLNSVQVDNEENETEGTVIKIIRGRTNKNTKKY